MIYKSVRHPKNLVLVTPPKTNIGSLRASVPESERIFSALERGRNSSQNRASVAIRSRSSSPKTQCDLSVRFVTYCYYNNRFPGYFLFTS